MYMDGQRTRSLSNTRNTRHQEIYIDKHIKTLVINHDTGVKSYQDFTQLKNQISRKTKNTTPVLTTEGSNNVQTDLCPSIDCSFIFTFIIFNEILAGHRNHL